MARVYVETNQLDEFGGSLGKFGVWVQQEISSLTGKVSELRASWRDTVGKRDLECLDEHLRKLGFLVDRMGGHLTEILSKKGVALRNYQGLSEHTVGYRPLAAEQRYQVPNGPYELQPPYAGGVRGYAADKTAEGSVGEAGGLESVVDDAAGPGTNSETLDGAVDGYTSSPSQSRELIRWGDTTYQHLEDLYRDASYNILPSLPADERPTSYGGQPVRYDGFGFPSRHGLYDAYRRQLDDEG